MNHSDSTAEYATARWRDTLKSNRLRTRCVMGTFIFLYCGIGFLIDLYWQSGRIPHASIGEVARALLTARITPSITLILGAVAVIAIWATYLFYDRMMLLGTEYTEVTEETSHFEEKKLYHVVEEMKVASGMRYMPRLFVIESASLNAFASGYSERSALIAVTRGLMEQLDREELSAVVAHELSHIRHLDIKLTLMASILSNLTLIILDSLFYSIIFSGREDREEGRSRQAVLWIVMLIRCVLPIVTVVLMCYLSRTREYMADAGCVELMKTNEPLARALIKIHAYYETHQESQEQTAHESVRRASYIFDPAAFGFHGGGLSDLFSTHPHITDRLAALGVRLKR